MARPHPRRDGGRARVAWPAALRGPLPMAIAIGVLTWPVASITPSTGLDPSWQVALALAARDRMSFGDDLVFTFGPLGFLETPLVVSTLGLALALTWTLLLQVVLALSIILAARRSLPAPVGVAVAFTVGILAFENRETMSLIVFIWCCMAIQGGVGPRLGRALVPLGGLAAAAALLTKVNVGIVCTVMVAVAVWWLPPHRLRALGVYAAAWAGAFVGLWLATGGSLDQIVPWLSRAAQLASGFTAALPAEDLERGWEYPAFIVLVGGLAFLTWRHGLPAERWRALCLTAVGALMAFAYFKRGFVRHDFAHSHYTFIVLMAAPVAVVWRGAAGRIAGGAALAVGAIVAVAVVAQAPQPDVRALVDPHERAARLVGQFADAARPAELDRMRADARRRMTRDLEVPRRMIGAIGAEGVHVDPYETSAVWAYGLTWRPTPVFQAYAAYTHPLDRRNAQALGAPDAPPWILRETVTRIGDRGRENESPSYAIAMFCNYSESMRSARWQLLRHTPGRCGRPRDLGSLEAAANDLVPVPAAAADELVYARFTLRRPARSRLRTLVYKPRRLPLLVLNDNYGTRFAAALAPGDFLMWVPPTLAFSDYATGFGAGTLRLLDVPSPFSVSFHAVRVAAPPQVSVDVGA